MQAKRWTTSRDSGTGIPYGRYVGETVTAEAFMTDYDDKEAKREVLHDETRDSPFGTGRSYGPGSGVAFLIGAILVVFAIIAYGMWAGDTQGPTTTTIEQPTTQPPATNPPPSPG
jgi:hypothetical protein